MKQIKCGNCHRHHRDVATVRACHAGNVSECHWLIERWAEVHPEDPSYLIAVPCGAHATHTDRGWSCAVGHSHVSMEARHAEGWDYAETDTEAMDMMFAGVEPRDFRTGSDYVRGASDLYAHA